MFSNTKGATVQKHIVIKVIVIAIEMGSCVASIVTVLTALIRRKTKVKLREELINQKINDFVLIYLFPPKL